MLKKHLKINTDLNVLTQTLGWFDQLKDSGIPQPTWFQCQLVLAEGLTNAIRHAHKDQPPEVQIELEVKVFAQHLEIRIWDQGNPFDLETRVKALPEKIDTNNETGRGLKLMQTIADQLTYTRAADHRNCLLITKSWADI